MSTLRVLYLFAGAKRRADLRHFLSSMCRERGVKLIMAEVDILRSGKHDLTRRQQKISYLRNGTAQRIRLRDHQPPLRKILPSKVG